MTISEAKKILERILKELTIDVKRVEVVAGDPHPLLSIATSDSGILIGGQGENLRALNYLVKKIVESKSKEERENVSTSFLIDVNGYHRRHIADVKQRARILAERARTFKADVAMEPMNSYDRLVVHAAFSQDPDVYTESVGAGKGRYIVFKYRRKEPETMTGDRALFSEENVA